MSPILNNQLSYTYSDTGFGFSVKKHIAYDVYKSGGGMSIASSASRERVLTAETP
jgi:hypothetical protein